jgi:hypothetical protein
MTTNRRLLLSGLTLAIGAMLVIGCASTPKKEDNFYTSEEFERNAPSARPPPDPCKGKDGEPAECRNQEDCCNGYSCSWDPDRSQVIKYCLQG